jgi:mono/diheme cytochrome c family protein
MKSILIFLGILIVIVVIFFFSFIYSGIYNVSALDHHTAFVRWILSTTMENSVKHHSKNIEVPALTDSAMVLDGFEHYHHMCIGCHGGPGIAQREIAKGLYPHPPKLVETADEWTPAELFWITKEGIKMTGMPAWGPADPDENLWAIVAFLQKLPSLSFEDFQAMEQKVAAQSAESHSTK